MSLQEFIDLEMDAYRNNVIRVSLAPYGEPCKIAFEDWNRLQQGGTSDYLLSSLSQQISSTHVHVYAR